MYTLGEAQFGGSAQVPASCGLFGCHPSWKTQAEVPFSKPLLSLIFRSRAWSSCPKQGWSVEIQWPTMVCEAPSDCGFQTLVCSNPIRATVVPACISLMSLPRYSQVPSGLIDVNPILLPWGYYQAHIYGHKPTLFNKACFQQSYAYEGMGEFIEKCLLWFI